MQRAVEARGLPTVSLSVAKDVSLRLRPPRVLFLPFMMGHHFGVPFHRELQRRIILAALAMIDPASPGGPARESGEVRCFPMTWAEARREGRALEAGETEPGPKPRPKP